MQLHILKHLHNSFIIYDIKYFFLIKIIKQLRESNIKFRGSKINKNMTQNFIL
jgi:hypothetical protein